MKIVFLGLGKMGIGNADNTLAEGFDLTVWNRTQSKMDGLIKSGAGYSDNPDPALRL
ncbi:MAG: hypothetical protein CBD08_006235 [Cellvibrionales bacterium TMED148]|nr:hypothetical protein [Porticoccaceae bacterium]RPG89320.1 MAG: hypothetical protein CBD08_006235 [Cellvibrionales bacterium TMED148]